MTDKTIFHINLSKPLTQDILDRVRQTINSGRLLICPTESSYLLGCNIFDQKALESIFTIKGRSGKKPLPAVVANEAAARSLVHFNELAHTLCARFWPGPLTIILPIKNRRLEHSYGKNGTLGLRVPDFPLLIQILEFIDLPLVSTSANVSNADEPYAIENLIFANDPPPPEIGLTLLAGTLEPRPPSTVVDLSDGTVKFLREGALPRSLIEAFLNK